MAAIESCQMRSPGLVEAEGQTRKGLGCKFGQCSVQPCCCRCCRSGGSCSFTSCRTAVVHKGDCCACWPRGSFQGFGPAPLVTHKCCVCKGRGTLKHAGQQSMVTNDCCACWGTCWALQDARQHRCCAGSAAGVWRTMSFSGPGTHAGWPHLKPYQSTPQAATSMAWWGA